MNWVSGVRCQVSGVCQSADAARQHPTPDTRHLTPRSGLTLVELLVVILIISILAAAVLGVAAIAGQTAREARTRNTVARLHSFIAQQVDTYKSRRVKVRKEVLDSISSNGTWTPIEKNQRRALARLYAQRELMLMELPQRWSDLLLENLPSSLSSLDPGDYRYPWYLELPNSPDPSNRASRTELTGVYCRQLQRICNGTNKITNNANTRDEILRNQGAECLFLIVMNACADGEARSLMPESMIGDTDGDGALEFLDGWGRPIEFLRWAPGFNSEIQANAKLLLDPDNDVPTAVGMNSEWEELAARDHDPFDIQRVELAAFRLMPLIVSPGQDGEFSLELSDNYVWLGEENQDDPFNTGPALSPYRSPFSTDSLSNLYAGEVFVRSGESDSEAKRQANDNIHNHLISMRPRR